MHATMDYQNGNLLLVDQRKLPAEEKWVICETLEHVAESIENMTVRGAPAIGCTAAFGLALDARNSKAKTWNEYKEQFLMSADRLAKTRPTAVNLFHAINLMKDLGEKFSPLTPMSEVTQAFDSSSTEFYENDIATCKAIGKHGADMHLGDKKIRVLTHCNAGALATAGYGTAVGVIRSLKSKGVLEHVYADETRPWMQGARLTAYELQQEKIDHTLLVEGAAAHVMKKGKIDWIVVGADRIAANGDVANKIGTYSLSVLARHHGVKFFVAAPWTTFDFNIKSGEDIPIEERSPEEITHFKGQSLAPKGCPAYNPAFDVSPNDLIDGIITESGVLFPPFAPKIEEYFSGRNTD